MIEARICRDSLGRGDVLLGLELITRWRCAQFNISDMKNVSSIVILLFSTNCLLFYPIIRTLLLKLFLAVGGPVRKSNLQLLYVSRAFRIMNSRKKM